MAASADGQEAQVNIFLPQSLCDNLAKLSGADASLEQVIAGLVMDADRRRRLASLGCPASPNSSASQNVGPVMHGGPEGVYERDHSTGRWRSISRTAPRKEKSAPSQGQESAEQAGEQTNEDIQASAENLLRQDAILGDLAAAQEAMKKVQAENSNLWEAAAALLPATVGGALRASWDLSHVKALEELEKKMHGEAWEAIRSNSDVRTLALISRKTSGCEGERALSVGAARNIFGGRPPSPSRECKGRQRSRPHVGKAEVSRPSLAHEVSGKVRQESPSTRYLNFVRQSRKGGS